LAALITEESAREFADILRTNIVTQKYKDFGAERNSRWKKNQQAENMYWLWLGTVLKSIKAWNIYSSSQLISWFVGMQYAGGGSAGGSSRRIVGSAAKKKTVSGRAVTSAKSSFTRIDPSKYVPQERLKTRVFGRGEAVSFGFETKRKRTFNTGNE
jgi:hypothetical protein